MPADQLRGAVEDRAQRSRADRIVDASEAARSRAALAACEALDAPVGGQ
jgi:hypothetical protein